MRTLSSPNRPFFTLLLYFFLCLFTGDHPKAQTTTGNGAFEITLQNLEQKSFSLSSMRANKFSVIVFLLPDCPSCQSYSLTLNKLSKQFEPSGVRFYGVFAGNYSTTDENNAYGKNYKIRFPLFEDRKKILVNALKARVAPEVFVLDNHGNVKYRGRIDDWMYAVGKKRAAITKNDLQVALQQLLKGQQAYPSETTPIGCIIE